MRLTQTEILTFRSSLIGFRYWQLHEAMMNPCRKSLSISPSSRMNSIRALSIHWRYVELLIWPKQSTSRDWTGNSILNDINFLIQGSRALFSLLATICVVSFSSWYTLGILRPYGHFMAFARVKGLPGIRGLVGLDVYFTTGRIRRLRHPFALFMQSTKRGN